MDGKRSRWAVYVRYLAAGEMRGHLMSSGDFGQSQDKFSKVESSRRHSINYNINLSAFICVFEEIATSDEVEGKIVKG